MKTPYYSDKQLRKAFAPFMKTLEIIEKFNRRNENKKKSKTSFPR